MIYEVTHHVYHPDSSVIADVAEIEVDVLNDATVVAASEAAKARHPGLKVTLSGLKPIS